MRNLLQNTTFISTACLWRCSQFRSSTPLTSNSLSIPPTSPRICTLSSPRGWLNWQLWRLLRPLPQHNGWPPTGDFDFPGKLSVYKRWKSNQGTLRRPASPHPPYLELVSFHSMAYSLPSFRSRCPWQHKSLKDLRSKQWLVNHIDLQGCLWLNKWVFLTWKYASGRTDSMCKWAGERTNSNLSTCWLSLCELTFLCCRSTLRSAQWDPL